MCGIIGILGTDDVAERLVDGLRSLEYRGYDSAGVCTIHDGRLDRSRAEGKLNNLAAKLVREPLAGTIGIAHTRWATHGAPTEDTANTHIVGAETQVHNENLPRKSCVYDTRERGSVDHGEQRH